MTNSSILNGEKTQQLKFKIDDKRTNIQRSVTINICQIEGDGSCLFGSIAHQLFNSKVSSEEHVQKTKQLRKDVVLHINKNLSRFENVLKGRIYERKMKMPVDDIQSECYNFVNFHLTESSCFGGTESLEAISQLYGINIVIISENEVYLGSTFNSNNKHSIVIVYRNRIHYDSSVDLNNEDISYFAKILAEKINQNDCFVREIKKDKCFNID